MNQTCLAICSNGERCNKKRKMIGDQSRCGTHHNSLVLQGPNTMALMELKYIFYRNTRELTTQYVEAYTNAETLQDRTTIFTAHRENMARAYHTYRIELQLMKRIQLDEVIRTGVDPDAHARQFKQQRAADRRRRIVIQQNILHQQIQPVPPPFPPPPRDLAGFAADPQNVHTLEAVRQTKEIIERVRTIPVPEDYRWNRSFVSKTIGEIITDCKLNSHAAAQMFNQYVSTVAVYDIEEGIYGKVLDSVWQYVKASPDKEDLCKILRQEMTDNIGMCAQGNLSRICNILAGYMEGIGPQESLAERLGRLMPKLMEIEDSVKRLTDAIKILKDNNVPIAEWDSWIDPLKEDDDMSVEVP